MRERPEFSNNSYFQVFGQALFLFFPLVGSKSKLQQVQKFKKIIDQKVLTVMSQMR